MLCQLVVISRNDDFSCSCFQLCLDLELELPWALFLGECSLSTHFPVVVLWEEWPARGTQKGASSAVDPMWLWHRGMSHMHEARVVMHTDNVVEVCRIILDGICTEWAT